MPSNTIKNVGGVTKEYLLQLYNSLSLMKGIKRKYSEQFGKDGAKIGDVLNVKYMDNMPGSRGHKIGISPVVERTIPVYIQEVNQYQRAFDFYSSDLELSVESFGEKTNLEQNSRSMGNDMEVDLANLMCQFPQRVGTLGTTPGTAGGVGMLMSTAPNIYTNAGGMLTGMGALTTKRTMAITPMASGLSVASLAGLQNPTEQISSQYREGRMGANTLNFDFVENVNLATFTTGTRSINAGTIVGNVAEGATTVTITGLGANATISQNEHFTIAAVNAVNPMNQKQQGFLKSFTVLNAATCDASGTVTVSISPAISQANPESMINSTMVKLYTNLPVNVNGTVDALPVAGAAVTFDGAASTTGVFNIAYQEDSVVATSVDLPLFEGTDKCVSMELGGIKLRYWRDSDIENDRRISRMDAIIVFTMVRKELGLIVWG